MEVSWNRGTTKSSKFWWDFPWNKPTSDILGYPQGELETTVSHSGDPYGSTAAENDRTDKNSRPSRWNMMFLSFALLVKLRSLKFTNPICYLGDIEIKKTKSSWIKWSSWLANRPKKRWSLRQMRPWSPPRNLWNWYTARGVQPLKLVESHPALTQLISSTSFYQRSKVEIPFHIVKL